MTLKLVPEVRKKLKKPQGELHKKIDELIKDIDEEKTIVVGDQTTINLFKKKFYPKIVIIDKKIEREPYNNKKLPKNKEYKKLSTKNPAGYITDELMETIKKALDSKQKTMIYVEGEEDLAVIPSIKNASINHKVLYGQPKKGIVEVKVNKESKKRVNKIIEKMERI